MKSAAMSAAAVPYCVLLNGCNMTDKRRQPNLAKAIVHDLWSHKLMLLLVLANLASALLIVEFAHKNRLANIEQDQLRQQRDELDIEWRHYVLEQRTLAEHSRVEALVADKLQLYRPKPADEVVVSVQ